MVDKLYWEQTMYQVLYLLFQVGDYASQKKTPTVCWRLLLA